MNSAPRPISGRVAVYALTRAGRRVDAYALRALSELRRHADHLMVVVGGQPLEPESVRALESHADSVIDAHGTWSVARLYGVATTTVSAEGQDVSQLLLSTDGWFGPIGTFDATITRMTERGADFWSMTDHGGVVDGEGNVSVPPHYQWYWFCAGERVVRSAAWMAFWADVVARSDTDDDTVERRLTTVLAEVGFVGAVAF